MVPGPVVLNILSAEIIPIDAWNVPHFVAWAISSAEALLGLYWRRDGASVQLFICGIHDYVRLP